MSQKPNIFKATLQCIGKIGIPNASIAQQIAKRQNQNNGRGSRMTAYHCRHCGLWHTGNTNKPKKPLAEK